MTGRPSTYSRAVADEICRRMAEGESLNEICRSEDFPAASTVRGWVMDDRDGLSARYARARELQAETWADEIVEIADNGLNDWQERTLPNGSTVELPDHEYITRSRLRVDTRKWLLSKLRPGMYGDKVQHANADGSGDTVVTYRWADPPKNA